jgi:hypothetical protein
MQDLETAETVYHASVRCALAPAERRLPWREAILLARYHLRVLNWWLFLLVILGFAGAGVAVWARAQAGDAQSLSDANSLSRFALEPLAGLFAGMLGSALIVRDPPLELLLATRTGASGVTIWRSLLTFIVLLLCSAAFLAWSLDQGINYAQRQSPLYVLLIWLAPVLLIGTLGLFGSVIAHNDALGAVLAAVPLAGSLFLYEPLLRFAAARPFFVAYTFSGGQDAPDWWANRLTLLGIALAFAVWLGWLLRREERLLGGMR